MQVGFNYPWSFDKYGLQIGPFTASGDPLWDTDRDPILKKPVPTFKLPPLFTNVVRNLQELSAMGITIVRWFLVANGVNYGRAPVRRIVADDDGTKRTVWDFTLPATVDPRFTFHLRELLKIFRAQKMQIIPSFIDFAFVGDSHDPDPNGLAERGRADCIRDKAKRSGFLSGLFLELLLASRGFEDVIYAWEVINEPIWMLLPPVDPKLPIWDNAAAHAAAGKPRLRWPIVMTGDLVEFLKEAIQMIEIYNFRSTVGHRFANDLQNLPTGNRPQFHYYAKTRNISGFSVGDPPNLPEFKGNPPPFLGEFASDKASADQSKPWPDLAGKTDSTLERLKLIESKGCELCLIWPDLGGATAKCDPIYPGGPRKCDPIKLHPDTIAQIKKYTGKP